MTIANTKVLAKVVAAFAVAALALSAFALSANAQTTTTTTTTTSASSCASFNRDLTMGSTGADVTALQTWLISKGFTIAAGATGYFGGQTQAALAQYQASVKISPAAGYFGPITRAQVNATKQVPAPAPVIPDRDGNDDEDEDEEKADARKAIDSAEDELADARDEVEEANEDNIDTNDAEDLLEDAEDRIADAEEAFDDEDYEEAMELVDEAEDLINEALDEIEENDDEDEDDRVSTSAKVTDRDGADNDYATFEIEVELNAFGEDIYIDQDEDVSFEYEVQDSDGNEVTGQTLLSSFLESSADEEGDYYVVEEDESERFTLTVVFNPLAVDEGKLFRLQLLGINYADSEEAPEDTWLARPTSDYRTKSVLIVD
jgi:peptidoglycan hydrolase-like protein with peptidoglycan-binding domain